MSIVSILYRLDVFMNIGYWPWTGRPNLITESYITREVLHHKYKNICTVRTFLLMKLYGLALCDENVRQNLKSHGALQLRH